MNIKFVDLPLQNKILKKEIMSTIENVVDAADFNMGKKLELFEKNFARFVGKKYSVGVNSGTDALLLSLMAYGIGPGDEVITAPNSYFSTAMVILNLGATPVFADINPKTYTIDPKKIEKVVTSKSKVIIPVHLYGKPADMSEILKIAKRFNLIVIEDACQAHGATYKGKTVPVSSCGAFSFFPGKNLGAFGDGGLVAIDDKNIYEKLLYLRNDGSKIKYQHDMLGVKSRLDTLQAAILDVKLSYLKKWNINRQKNAKLYSALLKHLPLKQIPSEIVEDHVFHLYVIETPKRDELQKFLLRRGIETLIHYPTPIHLQKPFRSLGYKKGDFPITEEKSQHILSLPMYPELTEKQIKYVASSISDFFKK